MGTPSVDLLNALRRRTDSCLYCPEAPTSWEHPLQAAIGGRIGAKILCPHHNGAVNSSADAPLIERLKPLTFATRVVRQGGEVGTPLRTTITGTGERVTLDPEGKARFAAIRGKDVDAEGNLLKIHGPDLDRLKLVNEHARKKAGARAHFMLTVEAGPIVDIELGITADMEPGIIKAALHLFAALDVGTLGSNTVPLLRGAILKPDGSRSPYLCVLESVPPAFPDAWPPRHDIGVFAGDGSMEGDAIVTLFLYGCFAFAVRLPGARCTRPIRHTQPLDGSPFDLREVPNERVAWPPPFTREMFLAEVERQKARMERIFKHHAMGEVHGIVIDAIAFAWGEYFRGGLPAFLTHLRGQLQLIPTFDESDVAFLVAQVVARLAKRQPLLERGRIPILGAR